MVEKSTVFEALVSHIQNVPRLRDDGVSGHRSLGFRV